MDNDTLLIVGVLLVMILLVLLGVFLVFLRNRTHERQVQQLKKDWEFQRNEMTKLVLHLSDNIGEVKTSLNRDLVNFSGNLHQQFASFYERTNNRFEGIEHRIDHSLTQQKDITTDQNKEIMMRMNRIDNAQGELTSLSRQMLELQSILQDKKLRGIFGEVELYSLLESAFGTGDQRYLRQAKLSSGVMVDALLLGFSGLDRIAVDAKFPLENFRKMNDGLLSDSERSTARKQFVRDVIKHINDIAEKYLIDGETAPFAFMFLPAEAVYAEIYSQFSEIVDLSYRRRVYLVSPTTLMSYLTAIRSIYLQQRRDSNALEIVRELENLHKEIEKYTEKSHRLYRSFVAFSTAFEEEEKVLQRLLERFDRLYQGEKNDAQE